MRWAFSLSTCDLDQKCRRQLDGVGRKKEEWEEGEKMVIRDAERVLAKFCYLVPVPSLRKTTVLFTWVPQDVPISLQSISLFTLASFL